MSKNQNFRPSSPNQTIGFAKHIPMKFFPIVKISSQKELQSFYKPTYSASKSRHKMIMNSSLEVPNPVFFAENDQKAKAYVKQNTQSTDSLSERPKGVLLIENKLNLLSSAAPSKEKFKEIQEVWEELNKITSPLNSVLRKIKNGTEEYICFIESQLEEYKKTNEDYEETKNTLKILKKRFQKIALENLEINNLIVDKENKYLMAKERIKNMKADHKAEINKREGTIKCLNDEKKFMKIRLKSQKDKLRAVSELFAEIKSGKNIIQIEEKVNSLNSLINDKELVELVNISSIDIEGDHHFLPLQFTTNRKSSFLSSADSIDLIIE